MSDLKTNNNNAQTNFIQLGVYCWSVLWVTSLLMTVSFLYFLLKVIELNIGLMLELIQWLMHTEFNP